MEGRKDYSWREGGATPWREGGATPWREGGWEGLHHREREGLHQKMADNIRKITHPYRNLATMWSKSNEQYRCLI